MRNSSLDQLVMAHFSSDSSADDKRTTAEVEGQSKIFEVFARIGIEKRAVPKVVLGIAMLYSLLPGRLVFTPGQIVVPLLGLFAAVKLERELAAENTQNPKSSEAAVSIETALVPVGEAAAEPEKDTQVEKQEMVSSELLEATEREEDFQGKTVQPTAEQKEEVNADE